MVGFLHVEVWGKMFIKSWNSEKTKLKGNFCYSTSTFKELDVVQSTASGKEQSLKIVRDVNDSNPPQAQLITGHRNVAKTEDQSFGKCAQSAGKFCSTSATETLWSLLLSQRQQYKSRLTQMF